MGYAGLNIDTLRRELARRRLDFEVIEDDSKGDYCLLRVRAMRYPHTQALLLYENIGLEPRSAMLSFGTIPARGEDRFSWAELLSSGGRDSVGIELRGRRSEDNERIAEWVAAEYKRRDEPPSRGQQ